MLSAASPEGIPVREIITATAQARHDSEEARRRAYNAYTTHLDIEQTSPVDLSDTFDVIYRSALASGYVLPNGAQLGFMMSLVAVGVLILSALSIVCFAAYKIRAKSFEVSTSVGKIASFSIKIISADAESRESARDRVELLGRDPRPSAGDEVSLPNGPLVPPLVRDPKAVAERTHDGFRASARWHRAVDRDRLPQMKPLAEHGHDREFG